MWDEEWGQGREAGSGARRGEVPWLLSDPMGCEEAEAPRAMGCSARRAAARGMGCWAPGAAPRLIQRRRDRRRAAREWTSPRCTRPHSCTWRCRTSGSASPGVGARTRRAATRRTPPRRSVSLGMTSAGVHRSAGNRSTAHEQNGARGETQQVAARAAGRFRFIHSGRRVKKKQERMVRGPGQVSSSTLLSTTNGPRAWADRRRRERQRRRRGQAMSRSSDCAARSTLSRRRHTLPSRRTWPPRAFWWTLSCRRWRSPRRA